MSKHCEASAMGREQGVTIGAVAGTTYDRDTLGAVPSPTEHRIAPPRESAVIYRSGVGGCARSFLDAKPACPILNR
jgi:hypothetical protein